MIGTEQLKHIQIWEICCGQEVFEVCIGQASQNASQNLAITKDMLIGEGTYAARGSQLSLGKQTFDQF